MNSSFLFIELLLDGSQIRSIAFNSQGTKLIESTDEIGVAWSRDSTSAESLDSREWECDAVIPMTYDYEAIGGLAKINAFRAEKAVFCAVTTVKNGVDLLERAEKHLKAPV